MTRFRVLYFGKPKMYEDAKKRTVKTYISEYKLPSSNLDWKERYIEELKGVMEEYEGIFSIEFFVPQ